MFCVHLGLKHFYVMRTCSIMWVYTIYKGIHTDVYKLYSYFCIRNSHKMVRGFLETEVISAKANAYWVLQVEQFPFIEIPQKYVTLYIIYIHSYIKMYQRIYTLDNVTKIFFYNGNMCFYRVDMSYYITYCFI